MTEFGVCKYCGQVLTANYEDTMTKEERDNFATQNCDCAKARRERDRAAQILKGNARVDELFKAGCEKLGFDPVENDNVLQLLSAAVSMVVRGDIHALTVKLGGCTTAKIGMSSAKITVERAETNKYKLEE